MSGSDDPAAASFVFSARNYFKATRKTEAMERGGQAPLEGSRTKLCSHCGRGFGSSKALYGHLWAHSVSPARSKTGILRNNSPKIETKRSIEEEDEGFGCLVCNQSFSSIQYLFRHMRIHRGTASNGVQQPLATSQESNNHSVDLLKDMPGWSQYGKRGFNKTAGDGDIILDAVPFRFYHGPAHPRMQRKKRKQTERSMGGYQDTSMEGAADSESNTSRSCHGRRSKKNAAAKAVKNLHRCEICGKTFTTGQALGGHKTYHRMKDPLKAKLVQTKTEQVSCGEVTECVTKMLLPGLLTEEALLPEQTPPRKMLDFDLNVPYQE